MGGVDDHGRALIHCLLQTLEQTVTDLRPWPLHTGITEQLLADHIGGEHQPGLTAGAAEQWYQAMGEGCLAAGRWADHQVAAERHRSVISWIHIKID